MKGIQAERDLVKILERHNIVAFRIPASGAARKAVLPDIVAGYRGKIAFFEVKHAQRIYIGSKRLEALRDKAERFGAKAFIAFRPKGSSDYFIIPVEKSPATLDSMKAKLLGKHIETFIREFFLEERAFRE